MAEILLLLLDYSLDPFRLFEAHRVMDEVVLRKGFERKQKVDEIRKSHQMRRKCTVVLLTDR